MTQASRVYSDRSNCRRAALKAFGDGAFKIEPVDGGFSFVAIDTEKLPAARVTGDPRPSPGLARLRAHPKAEEIRESAIADQEAEKARQAATTLSTDGFRPPAFLCAARAPDAVGDDAAATDMPAAAAPAPRAAGKRAAFIAAAEAGVLPDPPDFSAETHKRFRGKLADLVRMADAGDAEGLAGYVINPISSSPKALDRYRSLCIVAIKAGMTKKAA